MSKKKRWLYIKNGNVCSQLNKLEEYTETVPEGGTLAFIGDFLRYTCGQKVFLLSCSSSNAYIRKGQVSALVLKTEIKPTTSRFFKLFLLYFQLLNAFFRILVYYPDRIICGQSGPFLVLSYLISRLINVPWVHSRHGSVSSSRVSIRSRLMVKLNKLCIRQAHAVICHGPYLKKQLIDIGVGEDKIFEFDVGHSDFTHQINSSPPAALKHFHISDPFVLYIGRIVKNKGIFDILSAQETRLKNQTGIGLVYAGAGRDLQQLKNQVVAKGLSKQVAILGYVERNQLSCLIKKARLTVVATRTTIGEGRCMAAMESLALGIPVVAPNFGPFPYLIENKVNGLLYQPDSVDDLKAKLDLLLDNESLYQRILRGVSDTRSSIISPSSLSFSQAVHKAFETV